MKFVPQFPLSPTVASRLLEALTSPYALFARAVVAGTAKGTVLLDDPANPKDALILTQERLWWQPLCSAQPECSTLSPSSLIPWLREAWKKSANIYADEVFMCKLPSRLAEWRCPVEEALLFKHDMTNLDVPLDKSPELTLLPFTISNVELSVSEVDREALMNTANDIAERVGSFFPGYMLLTETGDCMAWCAVDYIDGDIAEIGVETSTAFRRKGYSHLLVQAVLRKLAESGIRKVLWHAPVGNIPSQKTAIKSGFTKYSDVKFLVCHSSVAHNILASGYLAMRQGHNLTAANLYEEAVSVAQGGRGDADLGEFTSEQVLAWARELRNNQASS